MNKKEIKKTSFHKTQIYEQVFLIRHGEKNGDNLTARGKAQAKLVAKELKDIGFSAIYVSDKNRCYQTAKIIAKKLKIPFLIDKRLSERFQLEHLPENEEEQEWFNNYMNPNYDKGKLQTLTDFLQNVHGFLNEKINCVKGNILIIAHSCLTYAVISYFYNINLTKNPLPWAGLGFCSFIKFEKPKV